MSSRFTVVYSLPTSFDPIIESSLYEAMVYSAVANRNPASAKVPSRPVLMPYGTVQE